jgi:hypothetical protein
MTAQTFAVFSTIGARAASCGDDPLDSFAQTHHAVVPLLEIVRAL